MSEKKLRSSEMSMSEAALVQQAREWTENLCKAEERGRTDFVGSMERIALRLRLPFGFLRELVYRPPKRISAGRYLTLAAAYDECLQREKYKKERTALDPSTQLGKIMVRAADYLASQEDRAESPE